MALRSGPVVTGSALITTASYLAQHPASASSHNQAWSQWTRVSIRMPASRERCSVLVHPEKIYQRSGLFMPRSPRPASGPDMSNALTTCIARRSYLVPTAASSISMDVQHQTGPRATAGIIDLGHHQFMRSTPLPVPLQALQLLVIADAPAARLQAASHAGKEPFATDSSIILPVPARSHFVLCKPPIRTAGQCRIDVWLADNLREADRPPAG